MNAFRSEYRVEFDRFEMKISEFNGSHLLFGCKNGLIEINEVWHKY